MNRVGAALLGAAATTAAAAVLRSWQPGGSWRWRRTNFRGREVDLLGGVSTAAGSAVAAASCGGAAGAAATLVTATGGVLGGFDDADVDSSSKGLRGHIRALQRGEVTTGMVKLLGISTASLAASAVATGFGRRGASDDDVASFGTRVADVVTSGVLIAGTANLVNLFDLRPGRALKMVGAISAPLALVPGSTGRLATGALGVVAASWEADLAEETMLGDAGANALGALAGTALATLPLPGVRSAATVAVVGLVLLSERVSFTRVIEATPVLRALDAWARSA